MTNLIRSDFKRFFKDKLFMVVCILAVVFAVITPLIYVVTFRIVGDVDPMTDQMLSGYVSGKGQFFGAFSFGNNLGLIAPLLIAIIFYKDFTFGTVRNKIISGHSRTSIFLSIFTVCAITLFGIMLAHALLTLAISLPFFGYQEEPFTMADFWYLLESLAFDLLIYLFAAAFVSWLCVTKRNLGMVIVLYIALVFGCTLVAGILQIVIMVLSATSVSEKALDILNFIQNINIFNSSAVIGTGSSYTSQQVCYYTIPPVAGMLALIGHGIWKFNRKDLK